jgi:hypothetical protein
MSSDAEHQDLLGHKIGATAAFAGPGLQVNLADVQRGCLGSMTRMLRAKGDRRERMWVKDRGRCGRLWEN